MGESAQLQAPPETVALVEQIAWGEAAARLRAQVAHWHPEATLDQVEDAFQDACLLALRRARGRSEGEVFTWLRTTTTHKVSEIVKAARREQVSGATPIELDELCADAVQAPEDELVEREDQADLERLMAAVLERLSERQRDVVALHARGRKRPQIGEHLGLTVRTVKRELERILTVGRLQLARFAGDGCEEGEQLVRRFAFGLASARELAEAQLHLAGCPRCAAFYERLEDWHQKAAAMLPLPTVEQVDPGIVERTLHGAADAGSVLRQQLVDGGAHLKQHAALTYYRAVDPTPLSGVRPGAAATAIAGCLALGGGASYCVERGVDPLGGLKGIVAPEPEKRAQKPPKKRPAPEQPAAASVTQAPVDPAPQQPDSVARAPTRPAPRRTPRAPASQPTRPQRTPPAPPPPEPELGPASPANSSSGSAARSSPTSARQPAPAPADSPGEFAP